MQQDEWPIDARGRVCARALAFALALFAADAAFAARLVDVRIGTHPGYARVVLETDAPATHDLVTEPQATPGEVVVRIAATSVARTLPARGSAPEVVIEPQADATTLARIRAAGPVRVETQVLRAPPRFVFDLRAREPVAAPAVAPVVEALAEPPAEAAPAPAQAPEVEVAATGELPSEPSAPEPVSAPQAEPASADPAPMPVLPPPEPELPPAATPPVASVEPEPAPVLAPDLPPDPVVAVTESMEEVMELPDVSAPPPLPLGLEPRSLAVGAALGIGLALLGLAALRERRATPVPEEPALRWPVPLPPIEPRPTLEVPPARVETPAETPAVAVAAGASHDPELTEDMVRIHRRLDARLAEVAARLDAIAARQGELDRHEGSQAHEIAAQRAAIARLQRAVPPPARPRQTGKDPA